MHNDRIKTFGDFAFLLARMIVFFVTFLVALPVLVIVGWLSRDTYHKVTDAMLSFFFGKDDFQ